MLTEQSVRCGLEVSGTTTRKYEPRPVLTGSLAASQCWNHTISPFTLELWFRASGMHPEDRLHRCTMVFLV